MAGAGKDDIVAAVAALRSEKLDRLTASITEPPTPGQERQLESLRRRSNIDAEELKIIADTMRGSYLCMKELAEIADKHDIHIEAPDLKEISKKVNTACDHALEMLNSDPESDNAPYAVRAFQISTAENHAWIGLTRGLDGEGTINIPEVKVKAKPPVAANNAQQLAIDEIQPFVDKYNVAHTANIEGRNNDNLSQQEKMALGRIERQKKKELFAKVKETADIGDNWRELVQGAGYSEILAAAEAE